MPAPATNINPQQEGQASRNLKFAQRQDRNGNNGRDVTQNINPKTTGQAQPGTTNLQPQDEDATARQLQNEQDTARMAEKAGGAAQAGGTAVQAGGKAAQLGGKAAQVGGKGAQAVGKVAEKAGEGLMKAGSAAMGSVPVLGQVAGGALMGAGAAAKGGGMGLKAGGKVAEEAGKAAEKGGKAAEKGGKKLKEGGKNLKEGAQKGKKQIEQEKKLLQAGQPPGKKIMTPPGGGASKMANKQLNAPPGGLASKMAGKGLSSQPKGRGSKIAGKGVGKPLKGTGAQKKPKLKKDAEAAAGRNLNKEKTKSIRRRVKGTKQAAKEVKDVAEQAGQQFTSKALRQSWLNLISSWGLTLIYINIHFMGKYFASSRYFSHFGQEWTAKLAKVQAVPGGGMAAKKISAGLRYVEIIALILLDFLLLAAVLLALIAMVLPFLLPFMLVTTILNKIMIMLN